MEVVVEIRPNNAPKITEFWAFVSRDKEGNENVCGATFQTLGMQPLSSGNPKIIEMMKPIAKIIQQSCTDGHTIHLLRFTQREEIEDW